MKQKSSLPKLLNSLCAGMGEIKLFLSFLFHGCWGPGVQSDVDDVGHRVFSLKGVPVYPP